MGHLFLISTFQFPRFPFIKDGIYATLRQVSSRERLRLFKIKGVVCQRKKMLRREIEKAAVNYAIFKLGYVNATFIMF